MSVTVSVTPTSGTHLDTVFEASVSGLSANADVSQYDSTAYPTEGALTYTVQFSTSGQDTLTSVVFTPNPNDGTWSWPEGVVLPAAATWDIDVVSTTGGGTIASTTVDVS